jgi:hypothetical protein
VQIQVSDEDAEVLGRCVEMMIEQHEHAKVHTESCVSVTDVNMLTEIVADYDATLVVLRKFQLELGSASV